MGPSAGHGPASALSAVIALIAVVGLEVASIALAVWMGERDSRRRTPRSELLALDSWLDGVWARELEAARRQAAVEAVRLIDARVPIVDSCMTRHHTREQCIRLSFADGTSLVVWSTTRPSPAKLAHLADDAVLRDVSALHDGGLRFGTRSGEVRIDGEILGPCST